MKRFFYGMRGDALVLTLMLLFIFTLMLAPFLDTLSRELRAGPERIDREEAFQIAEAGIDYYQWHLAHYPTDYQDGTTTPGPYVHPYVDLDTEQPLGSFSLTIEPPGPGSTIVTIQSTGWTNDDPQETRTVTARYGIPSLAQYSFLSNSTVWIGSDESVSGKFQSNNGIRFDGSGNAPIMSAESSYACPISQGCSASPPQIKPGIWGSASPAVQSLWQFPVPAIDFSALTANLAALKSSAQSGGIYLPPSSAQGYSLVFNSDGTVSVYKVTSLESNPSATDVNNQSVSQYTDYDARTLQFTQAIPANGVIYVEDTTWVEGTIKGRVMVAAAKLPYVSGAAPTIYIPNNILYAARDGSSVLGLLAQNNIVVTYHAPTNLEIDAALIAQNGSAQFYYYPTGGTAVKSSITIFGSIMTYGQWTWTWVNGTTDISGYKTTNDVYDGNLLYGPPPGFPVSTAGYQQLSWTSN